MKDLTDDIWKQLSGKSVAIFAKALGAENVRADDKGVTLTFRFDDEGISLAQFNRFGTLAAELGIVMHAAAADKAPVTGIITHAHGGAEIFIPREQKNIMNLITVAEQISTTTEVALKSPKRPVLPNEPEYALVNVTGVPWNHVQHSVYGAAVVEAEALPNTRQKRSKQEYGVGYALLDDSKASGETKEWLAHQEQVENKQGVNPITAVPIEWTSRARIDRLITADKMVKASLPKVFRRD